MGDVRAMLFVSMIKQVFLYEDDAMLLVNLNDLQCILDCMM